MLPVVQPSAVAVASASAVPAAAAIQVPLTIRIPQPASSSARRSVKYISSATKSAVVTFSGTAQLTPVSVVTSCATTCTLLLNVTPGVVTFVIDLYDGANGHGNILSTGTTTQTIVTGKTNTFTIAFGGVVANLALALGSSTVTAGTAATIPVIVNALDASGETIVGSDAYATPITLSDDDASGATHLSGTSIAAPGAAVSLIYSGANAPASIHIAAAAAGAAVKTATLSVTPMSGATAPASAFIQTATAAGALAIYPLNDIGAVLTDAGPSHINGTQGATVQTTAVGLAFNGTSGVQFPGGTGVASAFDKTAPSAVLQPTGAISVEAWIQPSTLNTSGSDASIVAYGQASPAGLGYTLQLRSPYNQIGFHVRLAAQSGQYSAAYGSQRLLAGTTYHVVATYDGTTSRIYVNGVLDVATTSGTGVMYYYPGTAGSNGLAIGGELNNTTRPQFAGAIADLAIYGTALSASTIVAHYVAGQNITKVTETPGQSDAFVDSVGVNTHFSYTSTVWQTQYAAIKSLLVASGIRHIRDAFIPTSYTGYYTNLNDLAASGIHSDMLGAPGLTAAQMLSVSASVAASAESFEGANEPDLDGSGWETSAQQFQQLLYTTMKGNPATANDPIYGPSVTSPQNAQLLGSLANVLDAGSIHDYFGQDNPGNPGYGGYHAPYGYGGSIPFWLAWETVIAGSKPVVATETGYGTNLAIAEGIDANVQAKYLQRTLFEQWNAGVRRTYLYQLMDDTPNGANAFASYGLVDTGLNPKPAYTAIAALDGALADPGATFATTPLSYAITGNVNNVHHTLLQRRDGTYELAVWLEASDWNETANAEITPAAQSITLNLPLSVGQANVTTIGTSGAPSASTLTFSNGQATLSAGDTISLVTFKV